MNLYVAKNRSHIVDVGRLLKYFAIRFLPISVVTVVIYIMYILLEHWSFYLFRSFSHY